MGLSKKAIKEFKEIYKKEFGKTISDEEAEEKGQRLLSLFKIIYRPIPEDWNSPDKMDTLKSLSCILIILQRTFLIQGGMSSLSIVKDFNILKDGPTGLIFAVKSH